MTDQPIPARRERARRALERSLRAAALPMDDPPGPELLARLDAALLSLPRWRREIFLAVRLDGASFAKLAGQTGLSVRQVEREVAKALAQIDRALDDRRTERWWNRGWG